MKKIYLFVLFVVCGLNAFAVTQNVNVQNHVFAPASFTINLGDTIRWMWVSGTHTTTSVTIPAGAVTWNRNITSTSTTYIYVPSKAGTYNYKCTPHAAMGMVASFMVVCPQVSVQINASGNTTFCNGGSVVLNSSSINASLFQWTKNGNNISATGTSYTAKNSGGYALVASNSCGSSATSNTINVTVNTLPNATITPADTQNICLGDSVKLKANTGVSLSYQWQRNGANIAGATADKYYAKQAGNYKVKVTKLTTGCSKTSSPTRVNITCKTAFAKPAESKISIYPSPTRDQFTMEFTDYTEGRYEAVIYDELGAKKGSFLITGPVMNFGNELANGLYYIEIRNGDQLLQREKVIKMK